MSATYDILIPDGKHGEVVQCPGRPRRVYAVVESGPLLVLHDLGTGEAFARGTTYAELFDNAAQAARRGRG